MEKNSNNNMKEDTYHIFKEIEDTKSKLTTAEKSKYSLWLNNQALI